MLHEILLSLSGQPSPLFNLQSDEDTLSQDGFPLLSPPEKALLVSLARLSRLHAMLRKHTSDISSSHPSMICRAVSTAISTEHLAGFQAKVIQVEKSILLEDSAYVGGYGIVPLSTMVGEFAPWVRRMEWLWEIVRFILPEHQKGRRPVSCTGAALIDHLRVELQTGYSDLEEMARQLVTAAEMAWMKQLSMWLLYGNLPLFGKEDFFVQQDIPADGEGLSGMAQFVMHAEFLPKFVSPLTASSILFIGKSLNHIRAKRKTGVSSASTAHLTSSVNLYKEHLGSLSGLKSPISTSELSNAITSIRLSLSQTTLSKLLPLPKILEVLSLLHDFVLLGRGEFAMALVSHADARVYERHQRSEIRPSRLNGPEDLEDIVVKEGDVMAVLTQTWTELYSLQNEEESADDELDLARGLIRLNVTSQIPDHVTTSTQDVVGSLSTSEISEVAFNDLLFPTPTTLSLQVRAPLDLFLSASDISVYSRISAYLLGIRRSQIRLSSLWKHTPLRRSHPSPWGPPRSNKPFGQHRLKMSRERDNARIAQMRPVWATCNASIFILSEIGSFFQGEVVNGSWQHFRDWIEGNSGKSGSRPNSRPGTANTAVHRNTYSSGSLSDSPPQQHDPEALTMAHRLYLASLVQAMFLTDTPFTAALRSFLASVDHFIALVVRLESIQKNMDLETDEGVVDALIDYSGEEKGVWHELRKTRIQVEGGIKAVVARLREIDDKRSSDSRRIFFGLAKGTGQGGVASSLPTSICEYVPRKPAGVDRLLMKLDFGSSNDSLGLDTAVTASHLDTE